MKNNLPFAVLFLVISVIVVVPAGFAQPTPALTPLTPDRFHVLVLDGFGEVHHRSAPRPTPTPTPPQQKTVMLPGDATMEMVLVPAGSFQMGSNDDFSWSSCYPCEQPVHTVDIGYDFYMGKTEVTQAQWLAVMGNWWGDAPSSEYGMGNDYPAYDISWDDCQNFITALNQLGQGTFRLPSEAEWEYACRAGTTTRFYFGDSDGCGVDCEDCAAGTLPGNRSDYMWYCGNNGPYGSNGSVGSPDYGSKEVGRLIANDFGLFDMHGNVREWCQDYLHEGYDGAPADGSAWESMSTSGERVIRGGSWDCYAQDCRSALRSGLHPGHRYYLVGFRVVRTP